MKVPVEQLVAGDALRLPNTRQVVVERVDEYDGELVVRWWRRAEFGEPGHVPRAGSLGIGGRLDGRYLGSLAGLPRGALVEVVERAAG